MGWTDDIAAWFDRAFGDPMSDAVPGTVHIVSASEPVGRSPYEKCRLDLVVEAEGVPMTTVSIEAVVSRAHSPAAGMTLPARISPSAPSTLEVDWDALAR